MVHHDCAHEPGGFADLAYAGCVLAAHDDHGGCPAYIAATVYCGGLAEDL